MSVSTRIVSTIKPTSNIVAAVGEKDRTKFNEMTARRKVISASFLYSSRFFGLSVVLIRANRNSKICMQSPFSNFIRDRFRISLFHPFLYFVLDGKILFFGIGHLFLCQNVSKIIFCKFFSYDSFSSTNVTLQVRTTARLMNLVFLASASNFFLSLVFFTFLIFKMTIIQYSVYINTDYLADVLLQNMNNQSLFKPSFQHYLSA